MNVFCAELGAYGLPGSCIGHCCSSRGDLGEVFLTKPKSKIQEVGRDNSSEETREQRSENHVVSTVAEWVERSDLTERKLG